MIMTKTDSVRLLKFVWQYVVTDSDCFMTMDDRAVHVARPGVRNDSENGVSYKNAEVIIDGTHYVGNIVINDQASDWTGNMLDRDSVVLHMVGVTDYQPVKLNGQPIPTAFLKYPPQLADCFQHLKDNGCKSRLEKLQYVEFVNIMERLFHERLKGKVEVVNEIRSSVNGSWNELFHVYMFRYISGPNNKDQYTELAKLLPLSIINLERHDPKAIEALLFGEAGYLTKRDLTDYELQLRDVFRDLQDKYRNDVISLGNWNKSGRPQNYPQNVLRTLCSLVLQKNLTFDNMIACKDIHEVRRLFNTENSHVTKSRVNHLIINFISPLLFAYGKSVNDQDICDLSVEVLIQTPPETNRFIELVTSKGVKLRNALDAQAALQLGREYCSLDRCTECSIGIMELKSVAKDF